MAIRDKQRDRERKRGREIGRINIYWERKIKIKSEILEMFFELWGISLDSRFSWYNLEQLDSVAVTLCQKLRKRSKLTYGSPGYTI